MRRIAPPLPRQLNSADPSEIMAWSRQLVDYVHRLPRFEIKVVEASTEVEHTLKTNIKKPIGVLLVQAYKTKTVDDTLTLRALPDWRRTADGLKVRVDTSGVSHTFYYLIIGEGE